MNVFKPNQRDTVYTLLQRNTPRREIARITGIDRKTIRSSNAVGRLSRQIPPECPPGRRSWSQAVKAATQRQVPSQWMTPRTRMTLSTFPHRLPVAPKSVATSLCEPHWAFIETQLKLKRNAMAIYPDLVGQHGFGGAYNSIKRFCVKLRTTESEQFDCLLFLPGEKCRSTTARAPPPRVLGSYKYRKPRLFVATLRYSRRSFRWVVWKSSQQTWAELHEQACRYFGGCPQYVVLDNLKEGLSSSTCTSRS